MSKAELADSVTRIERIQNWYEYRGVRFYTVEEPLKFPLLDAVYRQRSYWAYVCIPRHLTSWQIDTPLSGINLVLQSQFEHIRREVSYLQDPPYNENWRMPSWYILAGWDYQHIWNHYDEDEYSMVADCMEKIDWLYENNIVVPKQ